MTAVFDSKTRAYFAENYPEKPHRFEHHLADNPLLGLEALAQLGETLPAASVAKAGIASAKRCSRRPSPAMTEIPRSVVEEYDRS